MIATVEIIPVLEDNYCYILTSENQIAVIDPGEAKPVISYLKSNDLTPKYILNTHHHGDHIGGNTELKKEFNCPIIGPASDQHRIADMDIGVKENDEIQLGDETIKVLGTPGHTSGHVAFYLPNTGDLFCGDTLFSMNMGYIFEGTPKQMWSSMKKLRSLPDNTRVYCGHEYTYMGLPFAQHLFDDSPALQNRIQAVKDNYATGRPTIPSTIGIEKDVNAFMNADDPRIKEKLGVSCATDADMLVYIRNAKNAFDEQQKAR